MSLCFATAYTSYASIDSETEPVKSWQEAVDEVKASRSASSSDAEIMTLDLTEDDYSVSTFSSMGTVSNTVDRTGVSVILFSEDWKNLKYWYIESSGSIPRVQTDFY